MIRASYYAMIDLIDHQIGRLLDWLEKNNRMKDTLIIFTSDHGESLGDHGLYLKGPYFYESAVHVPLIVACPGKIPAGGVNQALVELVDLPETICDAVKIPVYEGMQGRNLWNLLCSDGQQEHRRSVYSEYYNCNINHRNPLAFATMVYDGRYKLVKVHDRDDAQKCKGELYDLKMDPGEHNNLYYQEAASKEKIRMLELLADRMAETCDPLPIRRAYW